jgi:hypothetical protein
MNRKYTINYIPHGRNQYYHAFINEIIKIDDDLKKDLKINLSFSFRDENIESKIINLLNQTNIKYQFFYGPDYMNKIKNGLNEDTAYSIKLDEDIFINHDVWNFFLKSADVLEDKNNILISPTVTTGIPGVDFFIDQFFDDKAKEDIYNIFLKIPMTSEWGVDYSSLNQYTEKAEKWIPDDFYNQVTKINHPYKGIHPVRISNDAQNFILDYIIQNFERFMAKKEYSLIEVDRPYFCNSIFMIKNETWRNIIYDPNFWCDGYDEVALNLYKNKNNLKMIFIKNGFAVHPSYNTLQSKGFDHVKISDKFFSLPYFSIN